jgi:Protein of unknown function (DUF4232)
MSFMRRRWRLAGGALLVAAAAALAGCGSAQTSSRTVTSTASTHSPPPLAVIASCRAPQLAATYAGTDGATGHLELTIALRNVSTTACRLRGYPRAALVDGAGRRLPLHVSQGSGFFPDTRAGPRPVVLAPGRLAHFGIGFVTNNEYAHAHVCRRAAAAMAAAPGGAGAIHWQRVSLGRAPSISPCGSRLTVSPIHA